MFGLSQKLCEWLRGYEAISACNCVVFHQYVVDHSPRALSQAPRRDGDIPARGQHLVALILLSRSTTWGVAFG
jgi:hypothetical protein